MKKGCDQAQESRYKMTKREFFEAVIANVEIEELKAFAHEEIEKMNARNAKRAEKPSAKAIENEKVKARIYDWFKALEGVDGPKTAKEVAEEVEISVQRASALCRQMVDDGRLASGEEKIKGRKVKVYAKA